MTQKRYTEIPKRQKCINKKEPYIGDAVDIVDDINYPDEPKTQAEINADILARLEALEGNT